MTSIEQYLAFQPPPGVKDELIQGEIVLSPSASPRHASVCTRLYDLLRDSLRGSAFVVRLDTSMRLEESESMPRPDVFVMDTERWEAAESKDAYPVGSPQLAIEVFSPSNATKEFRLKPALYLAGGGERSMGGAARIADDRSSHIRGLADLRCRGRDCAANAFAGRNDPGRGCVREMRLY